MVRVRWPVGALAALALLVAACGSDGQRGTSDSAPTSPATASTQTAPSTQAAPAVRRGGTLVVALGNNPRNFDPMLANDSASAAIVGNVFEGLYVYDKAFNPHPWLAERVEQPDELTYLFMLRQGIRFHDGTEMDVEAVKFSMDRIRENRASPGYADGRLIAETVVLDRYSFKVVLKEPFAPFPSRLVGRLGAVVSPIAVKALGDENFILSTAPRKLIPH